MAEKMFEVERKAEEPYEILHLHLRIPKRRRLLPAATRDHLRAATRETLLAWRSVLDALIEKAEKQPKTATKIQVE